MSQLKKFLIFISSVLSVPSVVEKRIATTEIHGKEEK